MTPTLTAVDTSGGPTADPNNRNKCRDFYAMISNELGCTISDFGVRCGQRWGATLADSEGRTFRISPDWQRGDRLQVSGDYPTTKLGESRAAVYRGEPNPDITISVSRQPAAIAQDIARRFLPEFHARWAVVAQRVREADEYDAKLSTLKSRLVAAIDGASDKDAKSQFVWAPGFYHEVVVCGADVRLEYWYVPAELAFQLIEVSERWRREHPED